MSSSLVGALTVAVILIVDLFVVGKGGHAGNTLQPFTFGHTVSGGFNGVFYGIILGVTSYIGFETAADFGEETANPRRSIPIAIIAATGFAIVFYLLTTYALTIGFGVDNGAAFGADPFALKTIANTFVGGCLRDPRGDRRHALCVHRLPGLRHRCCTDAVRHGPRRRAARLVLAHSSALQDPGQRHRRGGAGGDGRCGVHRLRVPAGRLRRRDDHHLLLLRNPGHPGGHPRLHRPVLRRDGLLPAHQGELQRRVARPGPR